MWCTIQEQLYNVLVALKELSDFLGNKAVDVISVILNLTWRLHSCNTGGIEFQRHGTN